MKLILTHFTALLLAPLAALHAADALKSKLNPDQSAGIDPDDGTGPRPDKAALPKLIPNPGISYPDGQQTADGMIHHIWDYSRSKEQEILMTTFREEDVLAASDEAASHVKANRKLVSKGGTP